MPVFQLNHKPEFPDPRLAEPNGLLAVGGDLSTERILTAYRLGIFPWFEDETPILWWSPDPRMVLFPTEFKRYKSLRRVIQKGEFSVTFDQDFNAVMHQCSIVPRKGQEGTWITAAVKEAYGKLHRMGVARSVEVWKEGQLVGGLYGLLIGKVFFGESMFHTVTDASKVAMWFWIDYLLEHKVQLIDAQQETLHLKHMGGRLISRESFLTLLHKHIV